MNLEKIQVKAKEDAKAGTYRPDDYKHPDSRVIYVRAYLGAREKMGLLGVAGPGKDI